LFAALTVALTFGVVPVSSQTLASRSAPSPASALERTGVARPVLAWTKFCERLPAECDVNPAEPATVPMSGRLLKTLNSVNRQVNTTIRPRTDLEHWGVVDRWDLPEDGLGDCEDYQLLKRKILVEQHGLPRRALRLTVVIDEQGEGHAVLTVRTDRGDLILDNKRSGIMPWHETGYVFVKREGQDSREWASLGDRGGATITTANR
jgi:predicted transglutaminase-like cysteine proteinase